MKYFGTAESIVDQEDEPKCLRCGAAEPAVQRLGEWKMSGTLRFCSNRCKILYEEKGPIIDN